MRTQRIFHNHPLLSLPSPIKGEGKRRQRACKPGSVHPRESGEWAAIPLGDGSPRPSSNQPGRRTGMSPYAAPIRSCTRWGLPCRPCCQGRGALLPHPFALTRPKPGGMLSVALSLGPSTSSGPAGRYPAPFFRGARTFLVPSTSSGPRPPGPLAMGDISEILLCYESARSISFGRTLPTSKSKEDTDRADHPGSTEGPFCSLVSVN